KWSNDASSLQLVDNPAGAVIAQLEFALNKRSRSLLMEYYQAGCLFKHGITIGHIEIIYTTFTIFTHIFGQEEGRRIATLIADVVGYFFHLGRIYKSALYPGQVAPRRKQHVATANKLVRAS